MRVDLNADVGESLGPWPMGDDAALVPLVTSVNVACGAHAGDPLTIERTVRLATAAGVAVAVGAHPGYPDLAGFGRRDLDMEPAELEASIVYQVGAVAAFAADAGVALRHVKPHGALYNAAARDPRLAATVARAVARVSPSLVLVGLSGSALIAAGREAGLRTAEEGFADRAYEADGSLRSRRLEGAVHADARVVAEQAVSIVRDGRVTAHDGMSVAVRADTICLHGDSPGAAGFARAIREAMAAAGITVAALEGMILEGVPIAPMGESALLVVLGDVIDRGLAARARAIAAAIEAAPGSGSLGRPVPAYASVLVPFDPLALSVDEAAEAVAAILDATGRAMPADAAPSGGRLVEVPVRYGGADGPDLEDVARLHGLRPSDVIELHASVEYEAFFLGFAPGFAYLGPLPASLVTPRLDVPRPRVPAGSVAIAGAQSAIYPTDTPGGWRLIGRTDLRPWDVSRDPPALILPGDRVRFVPVATAAR